MSSARATVLADAYESHRGRFSELREVGGPDLAFARWILSEPEDAELPWPEAERSGSERDFRTLVVQGFQLAARDGTADIEAFDSGMRWMSGRALAVDGDAAPFLADAVTMLGLGIGIRALLEAERDIQETLRWFQEAIVAAGRLPMMDCWEKVLLSAASNAIGLDLVVDLETCPDCAEAMASKGLIPHQPALAKSAWVHALRPAAPESRAVVSIIRLAALEQLLRSVAVEVACPSIADLVAVLERVPHALRRWTWESRASVRGGTPRQWEIENEYHVQNLLYALLYPLFPDLRDEENLQSVGQKKPRVDFEIPSLDCLLEIKFMRPKVKPQEIIGEIAEDASLYRAGPGRMSSIVVFVWDEGRNVQEHGLLKRGIEQFDAVLSAVVVAAPQWHQPELTLGSHAT